MYPAMQIGLLDQSIVLLYALAMLGVGLYLRRSITTFEQLTIADRQLSAPLLVCTLVSTYYGLGVLLAGSEISYESGVVNFFFDTSPAYLAILAAALLLAPRLQGRSFRSIPDIVGARFGLVPQICAALSCFIYALPAFSIMGLGGLLHILFGIPFTWGLIIGSALALAYTAMGGLLAVALTDTAQFALMAISLALVGYIGLPILGGVSSLEQTLPTHFEPTGGRPLALLFVYGLTSLSILVEPAFYQRIFAARSQHTIVVAMLIGVVFWMSYDWIVTVLGIAARAAVDSGYISEPSSPDQAVIHFAIHVLPNGIKGLFAAGIVAAAMSTVDSYLLVSASSLVYDIWHPLSGCRMSDAELVRRTRWTMLFTTVVNILLCLYFRNVERLWIFITAVLVCTSLIPVLSALCWPKVQRRAGRLTTIVGFVSVTSFYAWISLCGEWVDDEATYLWQGQIFGRDLLINQDYGMLYILPLVFAVFVLAHLVPQRSEQ